MPFHAATLTPQNRHCRAMIADWLKLRNRKTVQPAEMSMEPPEEITGSVRRPAAEPAAEPEPAADPAQSVNLRESPMIFTLPIFSMNRAEMMLPGNTARLPRKLTR